MCRVLGNKRGVSLLGYFKQCLNRISYIDNLESIGFPYGMGCRLAGGNQTDYTEILEKFAEHVAKKNVKVLWYKYDWTKNKRTTRTIFLKYLELGN